MTEQAAHARPSPAAVSDAVFKTLVEGVLLLGLAIAHFAIGLSFGALIAAGILLLIGSLAADAYLFGSIGRAFAARRALHFKASPFLVAALLVFFLLPAEGDGEKLVRFALAAGIGGIVTGLLNLGEGRRVDA
jgi:hypothetical protein